MSRPEPRQDRDPDVETAAQWAAWERAGLYDPASPKADERRALLEYLSARGATLEQMVEAYAAGVLSGLAGDLVSPPPPTEPVRALAARTGIPLERVLRILQAAGTPALPDTEVPTDQDDVMAAFELGAALMGEDAVLAFTRVLGAAAIGIAEAAVALFWSEFGPGMAREGRDELARAELAAAATSAFAPVPEAMARLVPWQFRRAQQRAQFQRAQSTESWSQSQVAGGRPEGPVEVLAVGFVDLVGSTGWAQTVGLREQNLALTRFESAAWSSAVGAGGRVVKMIGDEVFFAAPGADAACRIGTDVCQAAQDDAVLPSARGSVGIGPVTPREGDYFGPLVNLVARLVKVGVPGQLILTSEAAAELSPHDWSVHALEPAELRGIPTPVPAFVAERRT